MDRKDQHELRNRVMFGTEDQAQAFIACDSGWVCLDAADPEVPPIRPGLNDFKTNDDSH